MYEDDEFARSLGITHDVASEPHIFAADDSEMMSMIFQYLETDGPLKEPETKNPTWAPSLRPTGTNFHSYTASNGSSHCSPSPTTSVFSESVSHTSRVSALSTPRTLSNSSSRPPSRTDGLKITTKPTVVAKAEKLTPPTEQTFFVSDHGNAQDGVERTQLPETSPTASTNNRSVKWKGAQQKRKSSYTEYLPSLSKITGTYERRFSKSTTNRNTMQLSGAHLNELNELSQVMPTYHQKYTPFVYAPQEAKKAQESIRNYHQRLAQKSPHQSVSSQEPSSAVSRSSQNTFQTYRTTISTLPGSNPEITASPALTFQINHPQPPPTDPSLRRYDSFKVSDPSTGRFEPMVHGNLPIYEGRDKGLDEVSPIVGIGKKFSFPKPLRAKITNLIPHGSSAPVMPEPVPKLEPEYGSLPYPSTPPAPAEPLPALLSIARQEPKSTPVPSPILLQTPARSLSTRSRTTIPTLTIQIPESTRPTPLPLKVEMERSGLTEALEKFKQEKILPRSSRAALTEITNTSSSSIRPEPMAKPTRAAPLPPQEKFVKTKTSEMELREQIKPKSPKRYQLQDPGCRIPNIPNFAYHPPPPAPQNEHTRSKSDEAILMPRPLTLSSHRKSESTPSIPIVQPKITGCERKKEHHQAALKSFRQDFMAPKEGLQLQISRQTSSFQKLTWKISSSSPTHTLSLTSNPNSHSRLSTFTSTTNEPLFSFQRKYGSIRVAETSLGGELFSVKDFSYEERGFWIVEFFNGEEEGEGGMGKEERWVVRNDEMGRGVEVEREGREVGRVMCVGGKMKGHDYMVDVRPGMNFAVMTALVTVFDDWRMDHGF